MIEWLRDELVNSDLTEQAAREQALRRYQADLDRLQNRLDTLYEDRLDGRIDAGRYDQKSAATKISSASEPRWGNAEGRYPWPKKRSI
jgi:hypothetical protein